MMAFAKNLLNAIALAKPRITFLALLTAGAGYWIAPFKPGPSVWIPATIGMLCLVGGANALNMFLERDTDQLMERTRDRPIPTGRLSAEFGIGFGALLVGIAVPLLMFLVNPLTGWLGVFSLISYVMVYTYMKRVTWLSILIGAIPGAAPPLMGWSAATGQLSAPAWILFMIIYLWQVPHFLAIGLFRKGEYAHAGLKVFPLHHDLRTVKAQMILYSIPLLPVSLWLYFLDYAGKVYLITALLMGSLFLVYVLSGIWIKDILAWAKKVFHISLIYLTLIFLAVFLDGGRS